MDLERKYFYSGQIHCPICSFEFHLENAFLRNKNENLEKNYEYLHTKRLSLNENVLLSGTCPQCDRDFNINLRVCEKTSKIKEIIGFKRM